MIRYSDAGYSGSMRLPVSRYIAPLLIAAFPVIGALPAAPQVASSASVAPVVMISIDGMKPDYVTEAAQHGLKLPTLRAFLATGAYAEGVVGVVPTVTFPSHTTLITGVWPAEHGVLDNTIFDPFRRHPGVWYWDFADIKVPTLYTAARAAGIRTANVGWPVTLGAPIDFNIAAGTQSEHTDRPPVTPYSPPDILDQLAVHPAHGVDGDITKTAEAVAILTKFQPGFMLVHFNDLDREEHAHMPFSAQANAALEMIDAQVGEIERAALAVDPRTRIVIVSDHGFTRVDHRVHLNILLVQAGLIQLAPPQPGVDHAVVESWQAEAWDAGGTEAIILGAPPNATLTARVRAVLDKAMADPANGIDSVLDRAELQRRGGFPSASFLVNYKDGYYAGAAFTGALVRDTPALGEHGYLPSDPAMRSTFMISGKGIAPGRDLGVIDMRSIAPTIAALLHIQLKAAKLPPLNIH